MEGFGAALSEGPEGLVGRTPIIRLRRVAAGLPFEVWAKAEFANPTGSVKDRIALRMIREAERAGRLRPGMTIVVATTGNTGISFAAWGPRLGYEVLVVMPEEMGYERGLLIRLFGASVISTPGGERDALAAREYARRLEAERPDKYVALDQWSDEANAAAHYEGTGREILEQLGPSGLGAFVAGVGSGGTLVGVARRMKEARREIVVAGVEPSECPAYSSGLRCERHEIGGIGDGFPSELVLRHREYVDRWITVSSDEAIEMARRLAREESLPVGTSSGANVAAAIKLGEELGLRGSKVVTVLPDGASRYFSSRLFLRRRLAPEEIRDILGLADLGIEKS